VKLNAMDRAYKKYHKELYLYALSLCRKEEMAMDLVNETFYKAFITSNQPQESFKYWLFKILKNHFIDIKRKNYEILTVDKYDWNIQGKSNLEPLGKLIKQERDRQLHRVLINLKPEIYREVIYLYYFGEMSIKNIAGILGKTENNTKITLYRARKKLGRILKEDDYEF